MYVVKKLPFQSESANIFMHRLDEQMRKANEMDGKRKQQRCRVCFKNTPETIFPKAPKGLPINFYDVAWYNNKLPAQKDAIADNTRVAFLENPLDSFSPKGQADEKLNNKKFAKKHWERATNNYNFSHEEVNNSDEVESADESGEDSNYGASIDLEHSDGSDDDKDEDKYEEDDSEEINAPIDQGDFEMEEPDFASTSFGQGMYSGGLMENEWEAVQ